MRWRNVFPYFQLEELNLLLFIYLKLIFALTLPSCTHTQAKKNVGFATFLDHSQAALCESLLSPDANLQPLQDGGIFQDSAHTIYSVLLYLKKKKTSDKEIENS